jgi:hypothetical protein
VLTNPYTVQTGIKIKEIQSSAEAMALLPKSNQVVIRIMDSERNITDRAKYKACQLDTNSLCPYTDDDYDTFTILKASNKQIFETQL